MQSHLEDPEPELLLLWCGVLLPEPGLEVVELLPAAGGCSGQPQGEEQDQGAGHHHAAVVVVGLPAAGGQEDGSCLISGCFYNLRS